MDMVIEGKARLEIVVFPRNPIKNFSPSLGISLFLKLINYPWDCCDPVWCSGKVLDRTSRGLGFISPTGPDFFTISIQCVC